jgi:3-oxoacyl-[acyl-carrier-protein] synthase II
VVALAISGSEMITSVGWGKAASFAALCNGVSGSKPFQYFEASRYCVQHAYEITDHELGGVEQKGRATRWLCHCVAAVLEQSGLSLENSRVAFLTGTGLRELRGVELWYTRGMEFEVNELHFARALRHAANFQGPVFTLANACAASSFALGLAADMIEIGEIDAAVVAGTDSITESMLGSADRFNTVPPVQVRPFDSESKNVLLGEGAAAVLLEARDRVIARGNVPLALLRGVGMSCDAYHETAPNKSGIVAAMRDAHRRANVEPEEIDLVMAHGTGTALNDPTEALAIKEVFGSVASRVLISAIKSMTGHTAGASGLIGVITAIEAMQRGDVPPTTNFSVPIPEAVGLSIIREKALPAKVEIAQINAFGFGGINAIVILEKFST